MDPEELAASPGNFLKMLFGPLTLQEPAGWEWNQHPELNHFSLLFLRQMKSENLCLKQRDLQSAGAHRELFSGSLSIVGIPFQQSQTWDC